MPIYNDLEESKKTVEFCVQAAKDKKALDIKVLEIKKLTDLADYFLICSAANEPQVQAIANHIQESLKNKNNPCLGVEGYSNAKWVLLDFGSVVVHIFYDYVRDIYDLEGLWSEAPRISFPEQ